MNILTNLLTGMMFSFSAMRGHALPELPVGIKAGYRNHVTNKFDVGIILARVARSYTIYMENGVHVSQNCIDLKWTDAPFEPKT